MVRVLPVAQSCIFDWAYTPTIIADAHPVVSDGSEALSMVALDVKVLIMRPGQANQAATLCEQAKRIGVLCM
jgi:hypothetical protein